MFKILEITIDEFRGIRNLTLKPNGRNFAVCGRNGTGKSGIVDAIEFALTGDISRLSGEGTSGVTVRKHAPHVDSRDNPVNAKVKLKVQVVATGNVFEIERGVENLTEVALSPDNAESRAIIEYASQHPEFVLSRRHIIKFILATAGNRAEQVQILLKLDEIEQIRGDLVKVSNRNKKAAEALEMKKDSARRNLLSALGIPTYSEAALLEAVNKRRKELKLAAIVKITSTTSLKDGVESELVEEQKKRPARNIVLEDIIKIQESLTNQLSTSGIATLNKLTTSAQSLVKNTEISSTFDRGAFLNNALKLIENDPEACPVCETSWEAAELVEVVRKKVKNYDASKIALENFYRELRPVVSDLSDLALGLKNLSAVATKLKLTTEATGLQALVTDLETAKFTFNKKESLVEILNALEGLEDLIKKAEKLIVPVNVEVEKLPDLSSEVESVQYLTVADERLRNYRENAQEHRTEEQKYKTSNALYESFLSASEGVLKEIYLEVQEDFKNIYVAIHGPDEADFKAELTPGKGKLSFEVDFYGKGFFPPGAYHSEGHQDSMGLCLYLALMRKVTNDAFSLSILDDVLMSVDSGHRKQVCEMIRKTFPNTQFILTTHDKIWLKNMVSENLIKRDDSVFFKSWTVDLGPELNDTGGNVWLEIQNHLKNDEVNIAAGILRRHLEYVAAELCEKLQASVIFKGERGNDLGELLPPAISKFKKLLKQAIEVAKVAKDTAQEAELNKILESVEKARVTTDSEYWQMNAAIHFNNWENLDVNDFKPVVEAFTELLNSFACASCGDLYKLAFFEGNPISIICNCGKSFSLAKLTTSTIVPSESVTT